jgi:two-component system cell cycle sensor histidine kinase/response regulator CckA
MSVNGVKKMENEFLPKFMNLRERALKMLELEDFDTIHLSTEEIKKLLHEIQTYRIEIELQNEDLQKTQKELLESREKFSNLYDFAPSGYITISEKGLILEANLTFTRMLSIDRKYVINQPFSNYISADDQDIYYLYRKKCIETEEKQVCEFRMTRKDNSKFWTRFECRPAYDNREGHFRIHSSLSDITEQKRMEDQLRQSHKMEAIGNLAGGIAHDFNNMLMAIMGNTNFILNEVCINDEIRNDANEILKVSNRAASLVQQLLAFSRKQLLQLQIINLNHIIKDMEKMLHNLIRENIRITLNLSSDLNTCKADPVQLQQIIMNLSINASDAMSDGGELDITTSNFHLSKTSDDDDLELLPGDYIMLTVRDTGQGMDKTTKEKIFDPFFTTKGREAGTGLGLSTVYGILKQIEGGIKVISEPGKGTTFKIFLPSVSGKNPHEDKTKSFSSSLKGAETILIVEDDEMIRKLLKRVLGQFGYQTLEAENGKKALQVCDRHKGDIDLLLTDVIMPGISGKKLADLFKEKYPDKKTLFISGYTDREIKQQNLQKDNLEIIQKPISPDELGEKIREVLDSK